MTGQMQCRCSTVRAEGGFCKSDKIFFDSMTFTTEKLQFDLTRVACSVYHRPILRSTPIFDQTHKYCVSKKYRHTLTLCCRHNSFAFLQQLRIIIKDNKSMPRHLLITAICTTNIAYAHNNQTKLGMP